MARLKKKQLPLNLEPEQYEQLKKLHEQTRPHAGLSAGRLGHGIEEIQQEGETMRAAIYARF